MTSTFSLGLSPKVEAPYPAWPLALVLTIEDALVAAEAELKLRHGNDLDSAEENQITQWLDEILIEFQDNEVVPGFNCDTFAMPVLDAPARHRIKPLGRHRPDIVFYRQNNGLTVDDKKNYGWFCECKILDTKHPLSNYSMRRGVDQFVSGDYAWGMPHGQMIGYVRGYQKTAYSPENQLKKHYYSKGAHTNVAAGLNMTSIPHKCQANANAEILISEHSRQFILTNKNMPGDIQVRHIWLYLRKL